MSTSCAPQPVPRSAILTAATAFAALGALALDPRPAHAGESPTAEIEACRKDNPLSPTETMRCIAVRWRESLERESAGRPSPAQCTAQVSAANQACEKRVAAAKMTQADSRENDQKRKTTVLSNFFKAYQKTSLRENSPVENWSWDPDAGYLVVKRKGQPYSVLIPFTAIISASLEDSKNYLRLNCRSTEKCVAKFEGADFENLESFRLSVHPTDGDEVLAAANEAIRSFP